MSRKEITKEQFNQAVEDFKKQFTGELGQVFDTLETKLMQLTGASFADCFSAVQKFDGRHLAWVPGIPCESKPRSIFDTILLTSGFKQGSGAPVMAWEITVSEEPARKILECYEVALNEGQSPKFEAELRAIARQHPGLVDEFSSLPWPGKK